jgi:hypothetical protein
MHDGIRELPVRADPVIDNESATRRHFAAARGT